jgi:hypothetical protein
MNMLINEITIRQELEGALSPEAVLNILQNYGWHKVGVGAEATIVEHPKFSYVLKIYDTHSKYKFFYRRG